MRVVGIEPEQLLLCAAGESELNLELMRLIDEQYTRAPFFGSPRMRAWLRAEGYEVNPKRIARLMQVMGLQAIYPKRHLSEPGGNHRKYPYLLADLSIDHPNQVWCTDITYLRMARGFLYLVAIMDWFSRYVLSFRLSESLEGDFCQEALKRALSRYAQPEIFNSDQGFNSAVRILRSCFCLRRFGSVWMAGAGSMTTFLLSGYGGR